MTKEQEDILNYLEESLSGAKMMGDNETMVRLSRAICAFKGNVNEDIFNSEFETKIPFL